MKSHKKVKSNLQILQPQKANRRLCRTPSSTQLARPYETCIFSKGILRDCSSPNIHHQPKSTNKKYNFRKQRIISQSELNNNYPMPTQVQYDRCIKTINNVKQYITRCSQQQWNLNKLNYTQLLKLLKFIGYTKFSTEVEFIENKQQQLLKKVYLMWICISEKHFFSLMNFFIMINVIEGYNIHIQKVEKQQQFLICEQEQTKQQIVIPSYIFFIKKPPISLNQNKQLIVNGYQNHLRKLFQPFVLNKFRLQSKTTEYSSQQEGFYFQYPKNKVLDKQFYQLAKPKSHQKYKKADEVQFDRNPNQYTFQPTIHNYRQTSKQKLKNIKNIEKIILRMKQARSLKEQKQNILKRGWTNQGITPSSKQNKSKNLIKNNNKVLDRDKPQTMKEKQNKKSKKLISIVMNKTKKKEANNKDYLIENKMENLQIQEQINQSKSMLKKNIEKQVQKNNENNNIQGKVPILFVDVNIDQGKKERIIIYEGDNAKDLSIQFGHKHQLDQQTMKKLEQMLTQQINNILTRIEEQSEEQSSILF